MRWVKPAVILLEPVITIVGGQPLGSKLGVVVEGPFLHTHETAPAYEADE
jgi:hypothetical protein